MEGETRQPRLRESGLARGVGRRFLVRSDPRVTPPPRMTRVGAGYLRTPAYGQPTAPPQAPDGTYHNTDTRTSSENAAWMPIPTVGLRRRLPRRRKPRLILTYTLAPNQQNILQIRKNNRHGHRGDSRDAPANSRRLFFGADRQEFNLAVPNRTHRRHRRSADSLQPMVRESSDAFLLQEERFVHNCEDRLILFYIVYRLGPDNTASVGDRFCNDVDANANATLTF